MDSLKKFFPFSWRATDVSGLIISLIIYLVGGAVATFLIGLLSGIPIIGIIFSLICGLIDLYALIGIVLAVLVFAKVIK